MILNIKKNLYGTTSPKIRDENGNNERHIIPFEELSAAYANHNGMVCDVEEFLKISVIFN